MKDWGNLLSVLLTYLVGKLKKINTSFIIKHQSLMTAYNTILLHLRSKGNSMVYKCDTWYIAMFDIDMTWICIDTYHSLSVYDMAIYQAALLHNSYINFIIVWHFVDSY